MSTLPPTVRVFIAVAPMDLWSSFDSLAGAVHQLGLDPTDGHIYLFMNKRRRIAKAACFEGSGWLVIARRLETGSFRLPSLNGTENPVQVDKPTLTSLLSGIEFTASRRGWYPKNRHDESRLGLDGDPDR